MFTEQLNNVYENIRIRLILYIEKYGIESKHNSNKVLLVPENLMFNLEGGRYLTEISKDQLIDNSGYTYSFSGLDYEQLAELADYFVELYENN